MWFANIFSWKIIYSDSLLKKAKEKYNISWRFPLNIILITLSNVGFPRIGVWGLWLIAEVLFRKPVWVWSRIKGKRPHETLVPGTAKPWPDSGWMGGTWRPLEHNQYHRGVPSPPWCQGAGLLFFQIGLWLWATQVGLTDQEKQPPSTEGNSQERVVPMSLWQEPTQQGRGSGQSTKEHSFTQTLDKSSASPARASLQFSS